MTILSVVSLFTDVAVAGGAATCGGVGGVVKVVYRPMHPSPPHPSPSCRGSDTRTWVFAPPCIGVMLP